MTKRMKLFLFAFAVAGLMACTPSNPTSSIDTETRSNSVQEALSLKMKTREILAQSICSEFPSMKVCERLRTKTATADNVISCFRGYKLTDDEDKIERYWDCGTPASLVPNKSADYLMGLADSHLVGELKPVPVEISPEAERAAIEVASLLSGILNGAKEILRAQAPGKKELNEFDNKFLPEFNEIENSLLGSIVDAKRKQEISAGTVALYNLALKAAQTQRTKTITAIATECEGYKKEGKKHLPHWCITPTADPVAPTPEQQ